MDSSKSRPPVSGEHDSIATPISNTVPGAAAGGGPSAAGSDIASGFPPEDLANLKDRDLAGQGLFAAEGNFLVERLLRSDGWETIVVFCTAVRLDRFMELSAGRCPVLPLRPEEMERVAGFPFHRGVLAVGRRPRFPALSGAAGHESLAGRAGFAETVGANGAAETGSAVGVRAGAEAGIFTGPPCPGTLPRRLVICPHIDNPENIGSIARTAAALGGFGLVIGNRSADPLSRKALKVSMGAVFSLPVFAIEGEPGRSADSSGSAAAVLKALGYRIVGAVADNSAVPLERYRPAERTALVLGNEAEGIPDDWLAACDDKVVIPMAPGADSFNVAVSAGILLYALR